ncbi:hypothetical protein MUP00_05130 [Candidatus Bathyarchaeota archaeon]|nr:hypothetical protein [Candidatus Bathyarchaeota archaeon]
MEILKRKGLDRSFPDGTVYWTRFAVGIAAGLACGLLRLGLVGLIMGPVIYAALLVEPLLLQGPPIELKNQPRDFYALGLGTYLAVWLTTWILLNSLLNY